MSRLWTIPAAILEFILSNLSAADLLSLHRLSRPTRHVTQNYLARAKRVAIGLGSTAISDLEPLALVARHARGLAVLSLNQLDERIARCVCRLIALNRRTLARVALTGSADRRGSLPQTADILVSDALVQCPNLASLRTDRWATVVAAAGSCEVLEELAVRGLSDEALPEFKCTSTLRTLSVAGFVDCSRVASFVNLVELSLSLALLWRPDLDVLSATLAPLARLHTLRLNRHWTRMPPRIARLFGTLAIPSVRVLVVGQTMCLDGGLANADVVVRAPALEDLTCEEADRETNFGLIRQIPTLRTLGLECFRQLSRFGAHLVKSVDCAAGFPLRNVERLRMPHVGIAGETLVMIGTLLPKLTHLEVMLASEHDRLLPFCGLVADRLVELQVNVLHKLASRSNGRVTMGALTRFGAPRVSSRRVAALACPRLVALTVRLDRDLGAPLARCPLVRHLAIHVPEDYGHSVLVFDGARFPLVTHLSIEILSAMPTDEIERILQLFPAAERLDVRRSCVCAEAKRDPAKCALQFYRILALGANMECKHEVTRCAARTMPRLRELYVGPWTTDDVYLSHVSSTELRAVTAEPLIDYSGEASAHAMARTHRSPW